MISREQALADIALAEKATPGPWRLSQVAFKPEDKEFIIRARTALPEYAKALMEAMEAVQIASEAFCSLVCPSTGTEGVPIPHDPRCTAMRESLAAYHGQEKAE